MQNNKVAILIKKAALVISKMANQVLAPFELTLTQFSILKFLFRSSGNPVRQADIEAHFSMTNPAVTGVIQNLEKKGLVERIPNPEDKRSKLLKLTQQAVSMNDELYELGDSIEMQVTKNLTEEERRQLITLLKKVLEN